MYVEEKRKDQSKSNPNPTNPTLLTSQPFLLLGAPSKFRRRNNTLPSPTPTHALTFGRVRTDQASTLGGRIAAALGVNKAQIRAQTAQNTPHINFASSLQTTTFILKNTSFYP